DRLRLLPGRVDGSLVHHAELAAALFADAVGPASPPGALEERVRPVDVELPARVLRVDARGCVEEVRRGPALPPVDLLLHGRAVGEEVEGAPDGEVGEERMGGLEARPLAVDLLPRVRLVALDVLDPARGEDLDAPLAVLLHALEDLVLHLHVPAVVVLAR